MKKVVFLPLEMEKMPKFGLNPGRKNVVFFENILSNRILVKISKINFILFHVLLTNIENIVSTNFFVYKL